MPPHQQLAAGNWEAYISRVQHHVIFIHRTSTLLSLKGSPCSWYIPNFASHISYVDAFVTQIIIAHRLHTIMHADKIMVNFGTFFVTITRPWLRPHSNLNNFRRYTYVYCVCICVSNFYLKKVIAFAKGFGRVCVRATVTFDQSDRFLTICR